MNQPVECYLKPGKHAFLIGIGGVSMSSLAQTLLEQGMLVSGSDRSESKAVERLRGLGIRIQIGHDARNISGADVIIRTAAVHDDNPEVAAARQQGIPVLERAEVWGEIMRRYRHAVCVAGTHGKTTTSSMVTCISLAAGQDPAVMIGGDLPLIDGGHRVGKGNTIILEACEYCNSFLRFFPTVAVVLNVEADHMDFFHSLEEVKHSFASFASLVPADGVVVYNADDPNTVDALKVVDRPRLSFGLGKADVRADQISFEKGYPSFDILYHGGLFTHVDLLVPGRHNILNALAAAAAAIAMGIDGETVTKGLASFTGTARRFELKGRCNGAMVVDDYAHHPGELHALFDAVEQMEFERVICAFQPHTYTRTEAFFEEFVRELSRPDVVVLAEIFAAREKNTTGISSADLAARIPGARYFPTFEQIVEFIRSTAKEGDLILTVGAGELNRVAEQLAQ